MNTYTFTAEQLRFILIDAINEFASEGYMHFSAYARAERDAAVDAIMANTIPTHIDEKWMIAALGSDYDEDDNVSPAAIGLQPPF